MPNFPARRDVSHPALDGAGRSLAPGPSSSHRHITIALGSLSAAATVFAVVMTWGVVSAILVGLGFALLIVGAWAWSSPATAKATCARGLCDRPQLLGFLPTMWFWNDATHQALLQPILTSIMIPIGVLNVALSKYSAWVFGLGMLAQVIVPILGMGMMERYIRQQAEVSARSPFVPMALFAVIIVANVSGIVGSIVIFHGNLLILGGLWVCLFLLMASSFWPSMALRPVTRQLKNSTSDPDDQR